MIFNLFSNFQIKKLTHFQYNIIMVNILSDTDVFKTYQVLPINIKEQVSNYLQFIVNQYNIDIPQMKPTKKKQRVLGGLEGKIWMSADFNEPM